MKKIVNMVLFLLHLYLRLQLILVFFYSFTINNVYASADSIYELKWLDLDPAISNADNFSQKQDTAIYVIQNRKYRKLGRFYVYAGGGIAIADAFTNTTNIQGRAGHFFSENWGIEGIYGKNFNKENDVALSVKSEGSVPFYHEIKQYVGGILLWAPFYGKINTFDSIQYFDLVFGFGIGQVQERNNREQFDNGSLLKPFSDAKHMTVIWDLASIFYLSTDVSLRLDLLSQYYKTQNMIKRSDSKDKKIYSHYTVTISLGYAL
ncbi:MAG: outer membrane beta-barrel domain-containing protein [Oligoflexia bacterium]|nr:outer membrane beta-barrel domain-containing protein [Oligoflexia bacterium]